VSTLTQDGRINDGFIRTYSGLKFSPTDPRPGTITLQCVAHALSQLCRFTGHTRKPYFVGQHSVYASWICPPEHALWALGHDCEEATTNDCNTVLKNAPGMEGFRKYGNDARTVILADIFGITSPEPWEVKEADKRLLVTEQRDLMPKCDSFLKGCEPLHLRIRPWSSRKSKRIFLLRFKELTGAALPFYQRWYMRWVRGAW
jgi:5'-nucleotidase